MTERQSSLCLTLAEDANLIIARIQKNMSINNPPEINQPLYQVLSFDVVLGALSVGLFAVTILDINPIPAWWIILPLAVWTIYTFDHLIDGFKKKGDSNIYRHRFHYRYRKILTLMVVILGAVAVTLSFIYLERQILLLGLGLSLLVVFYLVLVFCQENLRIRYIQKEMFIAVVYVVGIFLAPLFWGKDHHSLFHYFIVGILFLLAWTESVMISFYDYKFDKADGLKSFTQINGQKKTQKYLLSTHLIIAVLLLISLVIADDKIIIVGIIIELTMNSILFALILYPVFFSKSGRFRWIGETVFLLPGFIVLF